MDRSGSDPTVHGQWVDADLLGELPLVEPGVPELTDQLIDLGLVATPARALDVMHPSPSPDLHRIGNHGVHRTLTKGHHQRHQKQLGTGRRAGVANRRHREDWRILAPIRSQHSVRPNSSAKFFNPLRNCAEAVQIPGSVRPALGIAAGP